MWLVNIEPPFWYSLLMERGLKWLRNIKCDFEFKFSLERMFKYIGREILNPSSDFHFSLERGFKIWPWNMKSSFQKRVQIIIWMRNIEPPAISFYFYFFFFAIWENIREILKPNLFAVLIIEPPPILPLFTHILFFSFFGLYWCFNRQFVINITYEFKSYYFGDPFVIWLLQWK